MIPTCEKDPILATIDRVDELLCDEAHWGQGPCGVGVGIRPLGDTRFCPMTALSITVGVDPLFNRVREYFVRAVPSAALVGIEAEVPVYNDGSTRKFADIKALISAARAFRVADLMKDKVLVVIGPGRQAHY